MSTPAVGTWMQSWSTSAEALAGFWATVACVPCSLANPGDSRVQPDCGDDATRGRGVAVFQEPESAMTPVLWHQRLDAESAVA
jgi:hypothetical protein